MKKITLTYLLSFAFILFFCTANFAQKVDKKANEFTFSQFEILTPLKYNSERVDKDEYWFLPDGLQARYGFGVDENETFGASVMLGLDWKAKQKMVNLPVFVNLRFSPELGNGNLFLEYGIGKAFALGRGDLSGLFQRYKLGYGNLKTSLFLELSNYGYKINNEKLVYISIGISVSKF